MSPNESKAEELFNEATQGIYTIPRNVTDKYFYNIMKLLESLYYQNKTIIELLESLKPNPPYPNCQCPK